MLAPSAFLAIVVDARLAQPVYAQIARQIRDLIASGALSMGATLPSVRVLASDLGVNLNTVARAYRLLEEEGFVEIESRAGVRVAAPGAHASPERRARLTEELRELLARMRQAGFGAHALRRLVLRQIARLGEPRRS